MVERVAKDNQDQHTGDLDIFVLLEQEFDGFVFHVSTSDSAYFWNCRLILKISTGCPQKSGFAV
jgi:hypothetical protein